jgi:DNA-binding beta-propeller fold protein YncE
MMNARRWTARSVMAAMVIAVAVGFGLTGHQGSALQVPGTARLIAFEPLPEALNDYCTWETAAPDEGIGSLPSRALASYQPAGAAGQAPGAPDRRADVAARKPLRVIHDPYAGFSTVFVDPIRNEVVLGDEYQFNLHVYDRLANAPSPSQKVEPKRLIGGLATNSQFVSSMYVDPKTGDIYATNNDSLRGLNIFGTSAKGNVKPERTILSPYGSFGLTVDEARQELLLTVQHNSAILVYPKNARGDAEPIRLIQGERTRMADPHSIAIDAKNRLLYVVNYGTSHGAVAGSVGEKPGSARRQFWPAGNNLGMYRREIINGTGKFGAPSVTVFSADASGNVAPLRVIEGPKTQLSWPTGVAIDPEHGELFVSSESGDSINVYSATADGNVAPIRVIKGARTLLKAPAGIFMDTVNDELWVANYGGHSATVYTRTASGDVAPVRVIRSAPADAPATLISNPYMIAYDTRRDQIIVPNCVGHPRIGLFDRLADKNAAPVRTIEGQTTKLNRTVHGVAYDQIHDEIVVNQFIGQAILTFRAGASGNEAPIRTIMGPRTQLIDPISVAVDPVNDEIYVFNITTSDRVLVFDRTAQGDVAPKRILMQPAGSGGVDPIHNVLVLIGRDSIRIFERTAQGNDKPIRVIRGPHTDLLGLSRITMYPPGGKIVVNLTGLGGEEDAAGNGVLGDKAFAGVWSVFDDGDVPPQWTIGKGALKQVRGITLDPKNKTVLLSDKYLNGVLTFSLPEMFETATSSVTN